MRRYDVDRASQDNEVQVIDGYFVHYLVPDNLETLPKHVVFVLDVSGSMQGSKLEQMKDAIFTVLDDMTDEDYFNIITFSSGVDIWDQDEEVPVIRATEDNKEKAIGRVLQLRANGGTNINEAILQALNVGKDAAKHLPKDVKSMIVFLTDGQPTEGVENPRSIQDNIKSANLELGIPIFTIAFGADADFGLVEKIASDNLGAARKIYDGSDAALQLENFYAQISSPLLTNLKLSYVGGLEDSSQVDTKTVFRGKELIGVGKLSDDGTAGFSIVIDAVGKEGPYRKEIKICPRVMDSSFLDSMSMPNHCQRQIEYPKSEAQQFLQHLYAYINIQQMMDKIEKSSNKSEVSALIAKATNLALKNNFVTDLTSLVVVKPDEEPVINALVTEVLSEDELPPPGYSAGPYSHYQSYSNSQPSNVQYSLPQSNVQYSLGSFSGLAGMGISSGGYGGNTRKGMGSHITMLSSGYGSKKSVQKNGLSRRPSPKKRPNTTTTYKSAGMSYDVDKMMDYDDFGLGPLSIPPSTTIAPTCNGNITFYSKTYHRGESLDLEDDLEDLDSFDNEAVSAVIVGDCCWTIFSESNFEGSKKTLWPNVEYKGVSSFGSDLFRNVSSVKKINC